MMLIRFILCLAVLFSIAACTTPGTSDAGQKLITVSTVHSSENTVPMMTPVPVPRCEKFISSMGLAEQKIASVEQSAL